jgi:hypothetical protein
MLTDAEKSFLYACCWGDATIAKSGTLVVRHSAKQKEYMEWKVRALCHILKCDFWMEDYLATCNGKQYPACRWHSPVSDTIKSIRKELYPGDKKTITKDFLSHLNAQSLAVLYMDDGNLHIRKRGLNAKGEPYIRERIIELALYVSAQEAESIQAWIKDLTGATMSIREPMKTLSPGKYNLRCNGKASRSFIQAIEKYKLPSMSYKFDLRYDLSSNRGKSQWSEADLLKYAEADKETRARNA